MKEQLEPPSGAAVHEAAEMLLAGLAHGREVAVLALEHALKSRVECIHVPYCLGRTMSDLRKEWPPATARPLIVAHRGQEHERRRNDERGLHSLCRVLDPRDVCAHEVRDARHDALTDGVADVRTVEKIPHHTLKLVLLRIRRVKRAKNVC